MPEGFKTIIRGNLAYFAAGRRRATPGNPRLATSSVLGKEESLGTAAAPRGEERGRGSKDLTKG